MLSGKTIARALRGHILVSGQSDPKEPGENPGTRLTDNTS